MQLSKHFLTVCAVALSLGPQFARGADTDAQSRARAALEQKTQEISGQPGVQPTAAAQAAATAAVPAATPAASDSEAVERARQQLRQKMDEMNAQQPAAVPPPPATAASPPPPPPTTPTPEPAPATAAATAAIVTPVSAEVTEVKPGEIPPASDSAAVQQARMQLEQKTAELEAQRAAGVPAEAAIVVPEKTKEEQRAEAEAARKVEQQHKAEEKARAKAEADAREAAAKEMKAQEEAQKYAEKQAKAEAKARQDAEKVAQAQYQAQADAQALAAHNQTALATAQPQPSAQPVVAKPESPVFASGYRPLDSPDLPVTAEKQRQLADLLAKYKADQISPEEYHQQRAQILSAP